MATDSRTIVKFFYEVGNLKLIDRPGWRLCGVSSPESISEHLYRSAVIAYVLADIEGADTSAAALTALFHDIGETRIGHMHRIGKRYVNWSDAATKVVAEQKQMLPESVGSEIWELTTALSAGSSKEALVVRDACALEGLLQAREYKARGNNTVDAWIGELEGEFKTIGGKQLAEACLATAPSAWWHELLGN